jgi:GNAT superfamily N-acetyltransferase
MQADDVPAAVDASVAAFTELRTRLGLPLHEPDAADLERQRGRMRHLRETDPAGASVADAGGRVVGLSQSFVREGYWVLALLAVRREGQRAGMGRALLERAMAHGAGLPGTIEASRDPSAVRLYQMSGFDLHPSTVAWGSVGAGAVVADPRVVVAGGGDDALAVTSAIDRAVRGSARPQDVAQLLGQPANRLLLFDDRAYAVASDERVVTLAGRDPSSATAVLTTALAMADPAGRFEVAWITGAQQWAYGPLLAAGLELHPCGPLMTRGLSPLPSPYIPSGGFG